MPGSSRQTTHRRHAIIPCHRNDLCRKIDLLFGLTIGATISNDFRPRRSSSNRRLRHKEKYKTIHPATNLFPIATIARACHHTLVECALPLRSTTSSKTTSSALHLAYAGQLPARNFAGVPGILAAFENDKRNNILSAGTTPTIKSRRLHPLDSPRSRNRQEQALGREKLLTEMVAMGASCEEGRRGDGSTGLPPNSCVPRAAVLKSK